MIAVRHEVNNCENYVAVQDLESAIHLAFWGLWSVGSQYNVGTLWLSIALTPNFMAV